MNNIKTRNKISINKPPFHEIKYFLNLCLHKIETTKNGNLKILNQI